jgi:hypothetical protein
LTVRFGLINKKWQHRGVYPLYQKDITNSECLLAADMLC